MNNPGERKLPQIMITPYWEQPPRISRPGPIPQPLPPRLRHQLHRLGILPSPMVLTVSIATQSMTLWHQCRPAPSGRPLLAPRLYLARFSYRISTSRFGVGQEINSNKTPLGLHRVARKIGGGRPIGAVFQHRRFSGYLWNGFPKATICHRILWLEGLEPGHNQGGQVDTFKRYIYIHGFSDETTLGRPQSHGCIHLAGSDLLPLFDRLPAGSLVWISSEAYP